MGRSGEKRVRVDKGRVSSAVLSGPPEDETTNFQAFTAAFTVANWEVGGQ